MSKRRLAEVRRSVATLDLMLREAIVSSTSENGEILLVEGNDPQPARSAIPGLLVQAGDHVIVTQTDGGSLIMGIARSAHPNDDLVFRSPKGRIVLEAATNVELRAKDTIGIESPNLDVTADRASLHAREASVIADVIRATADELATTVGRLELRARRIIERAVDVVRAYEGAFHLTAGRSHTVIREAFDLVSKRTSISSEEDTIVDGKRVLLG